MQFAGAGFRIDGKPIKASPSVASLSQSVVAPLRRGDVCQGRVRRQERAVPLPERHHRTAEVSLRAAPTLVIDRSATAVAASESAVLTPPFVPGKVCVAAVHFGSRMPAALLAERRPGRPDCRGTWACIPALQRGR